MTGPILVAVAGSEPEAFWSIVRDLLEGDARGGDAAPAVEIVHVVDTGPRHELDLQFLRRPGHPRPPDFDARAADAERRGSDAILAEAATRAGGAAGAVSTVSLNGRPEREIVERAAAVGASLVVVAARPRPGPTPPGPPSVGHVARFVLDHAPCPVLLVRVPAGADRGVPQPRVSR